MKTESFQSSNDSKALKWRNALLAEGVTLRDVVENLDKTAFQISLIVNQNGELIGTLTDGDIRRGILRGMSVSDSVDNLIQRSPLVVPDDLSTDMVLELMRVNKVHQLPILDKTRKVVGLHILDDLISPCARDNILVIMAGGLGTRLRPHTEHCPKPLLNVSGKPMMEHIIERAKKHGFNKFIVSVNYLGYMIEDYFGDGQKWGVKIDYIKEDQPMGTAGSLSMISEMPLLPFIVTNGDVLTDVHYGEMLDFHLQNDTQATMAIRLYEWKNPYGVVRVDGLDILGFEEKPVIRSHINAGIYVIEPSVLELIPQNAFFDMPSLFDELRKKNMRTIVYPIHEPWVDIGRPDEYRLANNKSDIKSKLR